eukprot:Nk52_evm1s2203 gene=Nk52_evmTU1s2203
MVPGDAPVGYTALEQSPAAGITADRTRSELDNSAFLEAIWGVPTVLLMVKSELASVELVSFRDA